MPGSAATLEKRGSWVTKFEMSPVDNNKLVGDLAASIHDFKHRRMGGWKRRAS